jgi:hypothetical protein
VGGLVGVFAMRACMHVCAAAWAGASVRGCVAECRVIVRVCTHVCVRLQDPASRLEEVEEEIERVRALQAALQIPKAGAPPTEEEVRPLARSPSLPLSFSLSLSHLEMPLSQM